MKAIENVSLFSIFPQNNPEEYIKKMETQGFLCHGRNDLERVMWHKGFNWLGEIYKDDRNWVFQVNTLCMLDAYFQMIVDAPTAKIYLPKIIEIMDDWYDFCIVKNIFQGFPIWDDMGTGMRAQKIALVFLMLKVYNEAFLETLKNRWQDFAIKHVEFLAMEQNLSVANHAIFHINGLLCLLWVLKEVGLESRIANYEQVWKFGNDKLIELIKKQFTPDAVDIENSPCYHIFTYQKVERILQSSWCKAVSDDTSIRETMARARAVCSWLRTPSKSSIAIGDGDIGKNNAVYGDLYDLPYIASKSEVGAKMGGYGIIKSKPEIAIANSSFLFLQGSFYIWNHKHADCLSFVWQEWDEDILIDSGKYDYNEHDPMRIYFKSTKAHNTLEFDNKSYDIKRNFYGSCIKDISISTENIWRLEGSVRREDMGLVHKRTIHYKPKAFVEVTDDIENLNGAIHTYKQWWQLPPHLTFKIIDGGCLISGLKKAGKALRVECEFVTDQAFTTHGIENFRGQKEPFISGFISPKYKVYEPTTSFNFHTSTQAKQIRIKTTFTIIDL